MSVPNHLSTVETYRAAYPQDGNLGVQHAWEIANATAYAHRDEGFGLRRKTSGNNFNGFAVDIVYHKPTNTMIDVLGDSEGYGWPQWNEVGPGNLSEWAEPVPPIEPPIEPPVGDDLEPRVEYLEQMVDHIVKTLRSV